jgi:bile acid:Na+ symporter, BASS family
LLYSLELEFRYFKELRQHAFSVLAVLLAEMILLPALGLLVSLAIQMPAHLRMGVLLIAACPVGDIANFVTLLANGNLALSVAINVISCLFSPFSMVLAFALYRRVLALPFAFSAPRWGLILRLLLLVTVPILFGMVLKSRQVFRRTQLARYLRLACVVSVLALCVWIVVTRFDQLKTDWQLASIASASLALGAITIGGATSLLLKMGKPNRLACVISFGVRKVGLAVTIAISMMNQIEYAIPSTVYFLTEVTIVLLPVATFGLRARL